MAQTGNQGVSSPGIGSVGPVLADLLNADQWATLREYETLLRTVNQNFNLLSRSERAHLWEHHILHCLVPAVRPIPARSRVMDWGTGGGLPAIPLAVVWPDVDMVAVDSNNKKARSVALFARRLGLANVRVLHARAEAVTEWTDYSVSRATAPLATLWSWHVPCAARSAPTQASADENRGVPEMSAEETGDQDQSGICPPYWERGLLCLKGGDLDGEIAELFDAFGAEFPTLTVDRYPVQEYLSDAYFREKELLHVYEKGTK